MLTVDNFVMRMHAVHLISQLCSKKSETVQKTVQKKWCQITRFQVVNCKSLKEEVFNLTKIAFEGFVYNRITYKPQTLTLNTSRTETFS